MHPYLQICIREIQHSCGRDQSLRNSWHLRKFRQCLEFVCILVFGFVDVWPYLWNLYSHLMHPYFCREIQHLQNSWHLRQFGRHAFSCICMYFSIWICWCMTISVKFVFSFDASVFLQRNSTLAKLWTFTTIWWTRRITDHCEASNELSGVEINWKFYSVPPDYNLTTFLLASLWWDFSSWSLS